MSSSHIHKPWEFCDNDYGDEGNRYSYARWFRNYYIEIWNKLKDAGLPVRDIVIGREVISIKK